jgi:NAD-dependent SIR2 family protein deacetylase
VLLAKVKLLAAMLKRSKRPVVYAGAGLSTASGILDYATKTGTAGTLILVTHIILTEIFLFPHQI